MDTNYQELFIKYCHEDNIQNIISIYNNIDITNIYITDNNEEYTIFEWLCIKSKLEIIEWLQNVIDYTNNKNIVNYQNAFIEVCLYNNIGIAKWLYNNKNNIVLNYNTSFIICSHKGNFDICKWLYSLNEKIDIDNIPFSYACAEGHIELLQWMYLLPNTINIHEDYEYIFINACYNGRLDICKWLYNLDPNNQIDVHINEDMPLNNAILSGNKELINWLQNI